LRQALPDSEQFIECDSQVLKWRENAPYTLDVREFEQLLTPAPGIPTYRENLAKAVLLYEGDLLPGCYEDWILPERDRLRQAYLAALDALAEITEKERDYSTALEYTRRLVQADPIHATANHRLIRLFALLRDRPAALKAYQNYARRLASEVGTQPDLETRQLYEALKVQKEFDSTQDQQEPFTTPLVGRRQEWQRLLSAWKHSSAGSPHMIFICGEAGIGKSRLIEEIVDWAKRQRIQSAVAYCYPIEGSLPYAPVVSWMRALPLPVLDDLWLIEISRLLPEISQSHPKLPKPGPLSDAWQRQRLFEALARGVLTQKRQLLLVIEDLQWCDRDTLEWLSYLLRFDVRAPIMILASIRWEEMEPNHRVSHFQTTLTAAGMGSLLELKPLDQAECFQLANQTTLQMSRSPLDPALAGHIYEKTEGNPLFIVETVRLDHPVQVMGSMLIQDLPLSEKAQAVLKHRIAQLKPQTRELACLAATIGRQFSLDILRQACGVREEDMVSGLDELLLRRIIREESPEHYDFSHDKLRQATFMDLSTAHRRLLHRKVAEAYGHLSTGQTETRHAEIASHYERAGLAQQAIDHYRQAARASADIFANADGINYLQRAITLASTLNLHSPNVGISYQELAQLYEFLGDLLSLAGDYRQALDQYLTAQNQPSEQTAIWKSCLYRKISAVQISLYRHPDAQASLDFAEQCVSPNSSQEIEQREWIDVQFARAQLYYWTNNGQGIELILKKVQPLVEACGIADQQLELLSIECQYQLRRERYRLSQATVSLARRRRELCLASGDSTKIGYATFQLGFVLLWSGETIQAQEYLQDALVFAETVGARTIQSRCLAYLSITNRKLKQIEVLRSHTEALLKLAEAIGEHSYHGVAWANKAWLAWWDGKPKQTLEFGQSALDCWRKYPGPYVFEWLALWPMLAVVVEQGDLELADRCATSLLDPGQQPLLEPLPSILQTALHAKESGNSVDAIESFQQALEEVRRQGDL